MIVCFWRLFREVQILLKKLLTINQASQVKFRFCEHCYKSDIIRRWMLWHVSKLLCLMNCDREGWFWTKNNTLHHMGRRLILMGEGEETPKYWKKSLSNIRQQVPNITVRRGALSRKQWQERLYAKRRRLILMGGGGSGDLVEILRITSANIIQVGKKGISSEIPWNICVILCNSSI